MKLLKQIAWKIYNKITNYEQKITDEFEYELWKGLESEYYDLLKRLKKDMNNGNDEDRFVSGEYVAYHAVWNNLHDRYFLICKKLGRLDEFNALKDTRISFEYCDTCTNDKGCITCNNVDQWEGGENEVK